MRTQTLTVLLTAMLLVAVAFAPAKEDDAGKGKNTPAARKSEKPEPDAKKDESEKPKPKKPAKKPAKKPEAKKPAPKAPPAPKVAHIRMQGQVLASPPEFSLFADKTPGMTLREWMLRLGKARNDDDIDAVALEVDALQLTWAQARELADAIARLNKTKPVYTHIISGQAPQYLLAAAGREVTMDPAGTLMITGLGAELTFFSGTMDWLGIRPQMIQIGKYKGAAEPVTRTGPSKELKAEYNELLDDLYAQLCEGISRRRRLSQPHVRNAIDAGPLDAPAAKEYRFVDGLVAKADFHAHVARKVHAGKHKSVRWVHNYEAKSPRKMDFSNPLAVFSMMMGGPKKQTTREPTVAIVHADGMIVAGKNGRGLFGQPFVGHKTMVQCFEKCRRDKNIKAVIFRVNSPGGSAIASELIYQAVRKCAKVKPVIVSVSGMAASGGYYIALGGQKILANPPAVTGSIGVVGGKMATTEMLGKLGITTYEFTRGRNAGLWLSRAWSDREREVVRKLMQRTYDVFVSRVRDSRGKRIKDVSKVAQGRIFTAREAARNGLIDAVGGFREAVEAAQSAAKIDKSHFIILPRPKTLFDVLYGGQVASASTARWGIDPAAGTVSPLLRAAGLRAAAPAGYLLRLARLLETERVLAVLPYHLEVGP